MAAEEFTKFHESCLNKSKISLKDFFELDFFTNSTRRTSQIKYSGEIKPVI
jgi:hypothetical protein